MEPAAPGTEDEVQVSFPVYSKKANETDRLLSLKSYFPNGSFGNVFELSYVNGSEHWYCNMCECPVMGRVYHHEIGKRHSTNVANLSKRGVTTLVGQPVLHVAAGEPVPPGFEGEVPKTCQIQERLDNYSVSSLIGLEYLLEIQEYDRDKEPSYLCMLCDKRGDPRTVIAHLVSYNHISQYLQRHFVKCYQALSPYMTKQYKRNWQNTMNKIAEAIEQKHGRLKPHPVEKEGFEEKKPSYWAQIFHGPHFSEKDGSTFENLVNRDEITKVYEVGASTVSTPVAATPATYIQKPSEDISKRSYRKTGTVPSASAGDSSARKRSPSPPTVAKPSKKQKQPAPPGASKRTDRRRSLSSVSSISSSDLSDYNAYENKRSTRRMSRSRSRSPYRRPYYERSPSPRNIRGKGVLPWQRSDYKSRSEVGSDRNKPNPDKVEEYKRLSVAIENDMEKTLKQHEKNPEKHPQYNEEWKIFWNKRYKELQSEGKDASNYDFKPEWIIFWNKRMIELHNSEVKTKKDALRRRLGLPDQPAPICFRITGKKKSRDELSSNKPVAPMASEPDQDHEVIVIEDKDEDTKSSKRSHSPWESEPTRPSSRVSREKSRERERSYERKSRDRERSYERSRDYKYRGSPVRIKRERSWDKWDREPVPYRDVYRKDMRDCYKPPPVMRDVTRQPVFTPPRQEYNEEEEEDTGEINIVGVLRLLTALEEKLGSLGPKVIDMLAQALAMEKSEANSSEQLLDNDVNCVLFETVKEKLKGQLLAGLVDYAQERAFKNAIKKIASLIHYANQRKNERKKDKPEVDPVKVPGIGTVDKAAIAKQIATALVLQGKTDVSQAELEQLINAVVGMAEASKSTGKPMTTASFIEQINQSKLGKSSEATIIPSTATTQPSTTGESSNSMEGLSDSDLQTLLQNFKDLSTEEQHGLITYLKKLEAKEPERVERLRKFVNLGPEKAEKDKRQTSPFSARLGGVNPTVDDPYADSQFVDDEKDDEEVDIKKKNESKTDKESSKIHIDSEEEDYTFDDVFQAANKKVKEKEMEKQKEKLLDSSKTETKINLMDAKALIANIMGNLNAKENSASKSVSTSSSSSFPQFDNIHPSITTGNIVQAMDNISAENVKNLESIVGNLQGKLGNPKDLTRIEDNSKHFSSNFQGTSSNFRTNFNPNLLNSEPVPAHSNQNIEDSPSPLRNQMNPNLPSNLPNPMMYGQNMRPTAPVMNRNPMMQQNVQYPMKNIYGAYTQNPAYANQANFNRPNTPGFTNQNFNYDSRYGYNNPGPRPGSNNFGGNRW